MAGKQWDVITGLDVCVDLIVSGDVEPRFGQAEQLLTGYRLEMGGSAAIFASQCAKLGLRTLGLGVRGEDDFGEAFERGLRASGVEARITRSGQLATGLGLALMRGQDRAILTYAGTIDALTPDMFTDGLLASARHLHIASPYLMPKLAPHLVDIARRAKELGLSVSLDPNWDPLERWAGLEALLPWVDVFLPNEQELALSLGLERALELTGLVVVKRGAQGASCHTRAGETLTARAHQERAVDAIGAGDSFDGGFVAAYLKGLSLAGCLEAGCACGSMNVRAQGGTSGQGDRRALFERLEQRGITPWPAS